MSADQVLFIGWNRAFPGQEQRSIELFNVALGFFAAAQMTGRIDNFEPVVLRPHGGDLNGFMLIRGSREKLHALEAADDFQDLITKVNLHVGGIGVISGASQGGVKPEIERIMKALSAHS